MIMNFGYGIVLSGAFGNILFLTMGF